jgi:hypothetical protein
MKASLLGAYWVWVEILDYTLQFRMHTLRKIYIPLYHVTTGNDSGIYLWTIYIVISSWLCGILHSTIFYCMSFRNFFTLYASDTPPFPLNKMKLSIQVGHWMVRLGILPLVVIISCPRNLARPCPNLLGYIGLLRYPSWTKTYSMYELTILTSGIRAFFCSTSLYS